MNPTQLTPAGVTAIALSCIVVVLTLATIGAALRGRLRVAGILALADGICIALGASASVIVSREFGPWTS